MTIQTIMMVALGFLLAMFLVLLVLPYYRRRTQRLAVRDVKRTLPLTEAEIAADKDRLRADFAIKVHKLEARLEEGTLAAARQLIEINRRDAIISGLEGDVSRLGTSLEEHENARRVLEQTIMDRLPKVEHRLAEAKKLLFQRDREITVLSQTADRQGRALEEATQINTQQRDEIHRLGAALTTRAARNRDMGDSAFDGEVALRSELEVLRDKSRSQAQLIARLQGMLTRAGLAAEGIAGRDAAASAASVIATHEDSDREIARLRSDLAEAESALRAAKSNGSGHVDQQPPQVASPALEASNRALKAANQDQAAEIARLKAALQAYEAAEAGEKAPLLQDSKIALKARVSSLEAQTNEQTHTIQSLRAELAAANERLARQASHFREEIRRLGAGTIPVAADPRRGANDPRRTLSDRINDPRRTSAVVEDAVEVPREPQRAAGFLKALEGQGTGAGSASGSSFATPPSSAANGNGNGNGDAAHAAADSAAPANKRPRLLERITGIDKPSA